MPRKGPIAAKDLKVYDVSTYPYAVQKKYGPVRYFRTLREARKSMQEDLDALKYSLADRLGDKNAGEAIDAALAELSRLPDTGGTISSVIDPYTGVRYHATVADRRVPE